MCVACAKQTRYIPPMNATTRMQRDAVLQIRVNGVALLVGSSGAGEGSDCCAVVALTTPSAVTRGHSSVSSSSSESSSTSISALKLSIESVLFIMSVRGNELLLSS